MVLEIRGLEGSVSLKRHRGKRASGLVKIHASEHGKPWPSGRYSRERGRHHCRLLSSCLR